MKLLLIAPSSGRWKKTSKAKLFNGRTFRFSLLSLLSVAAETPPDVEVKIIDEQVEDIPWHEHFDLVGITSMTALAPRAYEICDKFRKRNIPVILGGMHPTLCPDEACKKADAVVIGDVESVWETVLADASLGRLKTIYNPKKNLPDLAGLKRIPRELLCRDSYSTINAVQATRGCPNRCDFCSVAVFHDQSQRQRPVYEVIEEISQIPDRFFILTDDNLTADPEYAAQLFKSLIPLNKFWVSQVSINITEDPDFVGLAAESGCIGLFVGVETFSDENLCEVGKICNRAKRYQKAIRVFHDHGIAVEAGIVLGFDNDKPTVFQNTLDLLDELEVDVIQASIFTPLPGTKPFVNLQNKIFDKDWSHYDFHSVVFQPKQMTVEDLQAGHDWLTRKFYSPWRIARRLYRHVKRPRCSAALPYLAAVNMAYYGRVLNWKIRGWNPALVNETKRVLDYNILKLAVSNLLLGKGLPL